MPKNRDKSKKKKSSKASKTTPKPTETPTPKKESKKESKKEITTPVTPKDPKQEKATKKDSSSVAVKKDSTRSKRFRKIEKITAEDRLTKGVVYLGHIPYGFREEEIKKFFEQFGTVTRVKLARSKKTARPKGYGFIEFESLEVAAVAADTVDKRFMFDRQLVCHVVEDDKVHKDMFKSISRKWKFVPYQKINSKNINSEKDEIKKYRKVKRILQAEQEKREKVQDFFNSIGKENTFNFPGYAAIVDKAITQVESN